MDGQATCAVGARPASWCSGVRAFIGENAWRHGHAATILEVAGLAPAMERRIKPTAAIGQAVKRRSKPCLALGLVESVAKRGPAGVPAPLARLIEMCVDLARSATARAVAAAAGDHRRRSSA